MNNLVFLGVQSKNELLQNQKVLQAMSLALAREEIASSAYQAMPQPAPSRFARIGHALKGLTCADVKQNKELPFSCCKKPVSTKPMPPARAPGMGRR